MNNVMSVIMYLDDIIVIVNRALESSLDHETVTAGKNTCTRIKCMNCLVAVVIAILSLVIHVANNFFKEKVKICPKMFSR